jgi:hypothetical protein
MLPHGYELPAAIVLIVGGALACFAGYRLFRLVLGLYGFVLGAMLASSVTGVTNTVGMVAAALVGGMVGALILVFAYFVGIALVGAGLGALVTHLLWTRSAAGDPPALLVVGVSIVGAAAAMLLQRYVIILGTSFGGAWTLIVGVATSLGARLAARAAAAASDAWILYPLDPAPGQRWVPVVWVILGAAGTAVQLGITAGKARR